jgi:ElaA protein
MMRVEETHDVAACQDIRRVVFIEEQGVAADIEVDGEDADCHHYLLWDGDTVIGTCRVKPLDETAKIQRVAVLKPYRRKGNGSILMRNVLKELPQDGYARALVGSQLTALLFYEKLGFEAFGPVYKDAGIDHRDMSLTLAAPEWD